MPAVAAASGRRVQEIVLCSNTGELYYEWQSPGVEQRLHLLNQVSKVSTSLSQSLSLGRSDRLEVMAEGDRLLVVLQPDRRALIRLGQSRTKA